MKTIFENTDPKNKKPQVVATVLYMLLILLALPLMLKAQTIDNPNFYFADNGITILCPGAVVGETGTLDGVTYTKRDRDGLLVLKNEDDNNPEFATSCTSGVTDKNFLHGKYIKSSDFNRDISSWDVSDVTNMSQMFGYATSFNKATNCTLTARSGRGMILPLTSYVST
ncbi:MAG: DUF285 domain-containing protein [Candidatus Cyclonatronum sp.]|uniref:BspA family leucine-rich repeat surface protein n=1 Tax=Cyclonatronum sp. TaxID=3024185 RepID=UPI0025BA7AB0|nr:BspA family leucine-rich repeat surface protein [Cyclonatronum sp.]MCH8487744.1 DUF285 domain-containing protein [Cyclonatronum sp.]